MFKNYFKIAYRSLLKDRLYTFINISGLTVGMTCFILIALYIQYDLSYDQHFEKGDQIHRMYLNQEGNEFRGSSFFGVTPLPLGPAMKENFPEVEEATTFTLDQYTIAYQKQTFSQLAMLVDENFMDVFSTNVIAGQGKELLSDPSSIILTQSLAEKIFGEHSPIGQTVLVDNDKSLTVRGIVEDPPENQHFGYDLLLSHTNYSQYEYDQGRWGSNNYRTYVVLSKDANAKELEDKLSIFEPQIKEGYKNAPFHATCHLQPLKDIHFTNNINFELGANSDIRYIYLFASIAFIILLLASINYMNLATARSSRRSKEVGMRKVLGARRPQIISQLLGESFLLTLISFVFSLVLVNILLPSFGALLDLQIPFSIDGSQWLLLGMLATALLVGGLSGLYPAIFLSGTNPIKAFQGGILKNLKGGITLRNLLVVGQFATAIILAIGTVVIYQQLQFIQNKKLGYNRDQVLFVPFGDPSINKKLPVLKSELLEHPNIQKVSCSNTLPLNLYSQGIADEWEGNTTEEELWIYRKYVDYDFLDLYEIDLTDGRNFSPEYASDSSAYLLNEAAVNAIGWQDPIGKKFEEGTVIGVVKDFHFQPFDFAIEPMFITFRRNDNNYSGIISIKTQGDNLEAALAHIGQTLKKTVPEHPLEAQVMDDSYNRLYDSEKRFGKAFSIFTFLALFIACMGLFGLVSHHVLQRTKEIGIRKVLGASTLNIVKLISTDFLKLVFFALLIAIPIAWYSMHIWLEDFVYRIQIQWWVFLFMSFFAISIALLTIGTQSIKAALANPVNSLRNE